MISTLAVGMSASALPRDDETHVDRALPTLALKGIVSAALSLALAACGGTTPTGSTLDSRCVEFDPNMTDPGICQIYLDRDSWDQLTTTTYRNSGYSDGFGERPYDDYSRYDGADQEDERTLEDR